MPRSMTGFARIETQHAWGHLICEIRSVNHRYLEPNFRLSESLRSLEPYLRDNLRKRLGRGKVDLVLALKMDEGQAKTSDFDAELAKSIIAMAAQVGGMATQSAPLNPLEVLQWPGVMKAQELDQKELETQAKETFAKTVNELIANREREGNELAAFIEQRLQGVEETVELLRPRIPELLAAQEEKLRSKLQALKMEVDEDRLTQELVYLAQKADVAEELDRLEAHVVEVRLALKQKDPVGRRLDFLMQELNREANTLSSKSNASDTTLSAVDLKVMIEQMREQVQNIE